MAPLWPATRATRKPGISPKGSERASSISAADVHAPERQARLSRRPASTEVPPPGERPDVAAFELSCDHGAAVARDACDAKAGDLPEGDRARFLDLGRERPESGSEDERDAG